MSVSEQVTWLKENSGLTWRELGLMFTVQPRTLHAASVVGVRLAPRVMAAVAMLTEEVKNAQLQLATTDAEAIAAHLRNGSEATPSIVRKYQMERGAEARAYAPWHWRGV